MVTPELAKKLIEDWMEETPHQRMMAWFKSEYGEPTYSDSELAFGLALKFNK